MKEDKKGFTLTEVIIVLVILGVLALILVPNIKKMMPNDHNIKYKKAFYTIQEIMNDIINDPTICPDTPMSGCSSSITLRGAIFDKLSTIDESDCGAMPKSSDSDYETKLSTYNSCINNINNIETTAGIIFHIPTTNLNAVSDTKITVSLSGNDAYSDSAVVTENKKNGIYKIKIASNGKVMPDGTYGKDLLLGNPTD